MMPLPGWTRAMLPGHCRNIVRQHFHGLICIRTADLHRGFVIRSLILYEYSRQNCHRYCSNNGEAQKTPRDYKECRRESTDLAMGPSWYFDQKLGLVISTVVSSHLLRAHNRARPLGPVHCLVDDSVCATTRSTFQRSLTPCIFLGALLVRILQILHLRM